MNYCRILLGGRLTRDPEQRFTQSGKGVVSFGLAVNRKLGDKEEVLFIDAQAWEKTGDVVMRYVHKGDPLFVEGRLRQEKWTDREGQEKSKMVVVVDVVQLLGSKKENGSPGPAGATATRAAAEEKQSEYVEPEPQPTANSEIPF